MPRGVAHQRGRPPLHQHGATSDMRWHLPSPQLLEHLPLIIMVLLMCFTHSCDPVQISANGQEFTPVHLQIIPPEIQWMFAHDYTDILVNCSIPSSGPYLQSDMYHLGDTQVTYIARAHSLTPMIAKPSHSNHQPHKFDNQTELVLLEFHTEQLNSLSVQGIMVGYASIQLTVYATADLNYSLFLEYEDLHLLDTMEVVGSLEYQVTVGRRVRLFDVIFDCVVATVATLNSFSMGCTTDWPSIRAHWRHPYALLVGLTCQFILLPPVSTS